MAIEELRKEEIALVSGGDITVGAAGADAAANPFSLLTGLLGGVLNLVGNLLNAVTGLVSGLLGGNLLGGLLGGGK